MVDGGMVLAFCELGLGLIWFDVCLWWLGLLAVFCFVLYWLIRIWFYYLVMLCSVGGAGGWWDGGLMAGLDYLYFVWMFGCWKMLLEKAGQMVMWWCGWIACTLFGWGRDWQRQLEWGTSGEDWREEKGERKRSKWKGKYKIDALGMKEG